MVEFEEHPSKVSSWRGGRMVVLPEADAQDCTVWAPAAEHSGGIVQWEGLLACRLSADRARICSIPFWLYDLNLDDEVSFVDSAEGAHMVSDVMGDAGNFTFRVIFERAGDDDQRWRELLRQMESFECWFDVRTPGYLALSARPDHAQAVADYLSARERLDELSFETGRSTLPPA